MSTYLRENVPHTDGAPTPIGPYCQAAAAGPFVYTAGQIGMDSSGNLVEGGIEAQARQAIGNIGAVLRAAGLDYGDVVKTLVFLVDMNDFAAFNAVYGEAFGGPQPPARSLVAVAALPRGALCELEVIALRRG